MQHVCSEWAYESRLKKRKATMTANNVDDDCRKSHQVTRSMRLIVANNNCWLAHQ